jgi:hypothetical protein
MRYHLNKFGVEDESVGVGRGLGVRRNEWVKIESENRERKQSENRERKQRAKIERK